MENETLTLYLTIMTLLLSFVSVLLIPLFKFAWTMEKRLTVLETKDELKDD